MKADCPLLILICGPYLSGTDGDPARIAANVAALEAIALPIYERGHLALARYLPLRRRCPRHLLRNHARQRAIVRSKA